MREPATPILGTLILVVPTDTPPTDAGIKPPALIDAPAVAAVRVMGACAASTAVDGVSDILRVVPVLRVVAAPVPDAVTTAGELDAPTGAGLPNATGVAVVVPPVPLAGGITDDATGTDVAVVVEPPATPAPAANTALPPAAAPAVALPALPAVPGAAAVPAAPCILL